MSISHRLSLLLFARRLSRGHLTQVSVAIPRHQVVHLPQTIPILEWSKTLIRLALPISLFDFFLVNCAPLN